MKYSTVIILSSTLSLAPLSCNAGRWVPANGGVCSQVCSKSALEALSSGTYTNGNPFYVCRANAFREGDRPGYNLEPGWAHTC